MLTTLNGGPKVASAAPLDANTSAAECSTTKGLSTGADVYQKISLYSSLLAKTFFEPASGQRTRSANKVSHLQQSVRVLPPSLAFQFYSACQLMPLIGHDEDAAAVGRSFHVVCDGVGGTSGCSGPFARQLVKNVSEVIENEFVDRRIQETPFKEKIAYAILRAAAVSTGQRQEMASTISVAVIEPHAGNNEATLHTVTLGDSKTIVLRGCRDVVFESKSVVLGFNYPLSVSNVRNAQGRLKLLRYDKCGIQRGDLVLTFSDGVHDNLFTDEIVGCCQKNYSLGPAIIASELAKLAKRMSTERDCDLTPISVMGSRAYHAAAMKECKTNPTFRARKHLELAKVLLKTFNNRRAVLDAEMLALANGAREFYSLDTLSLHAQRRTGKEDDIAVCVTLVM